MENTKLKKHNIRQINVIYVDLKQIKINKNNINFKINLLCYILMFIIDYKPSKKDDSNPISSFDRKYS